jgi:hypothetical protein
MKGRMKMGYRETEKQKRLRMQAWQKEREEKSHQRGKEVGEALITTGVDCEREVTRYMYGSESETLKDAWEKESQIRLNLDKESFYEGILSALLPTFFTIQRERSQKSPSTNDSCRSSTHILRRARMDANGVVQIIPMRSGRTK